MVIWNTKNVQFHPLKWIYIQRVKDKKVFSQSLNVTDKYNINVHEYSYLVYLLFLIQVSFKIFHAINVEAVF